MHLKVSSFNLEMQGPRGAPGKERPDEAVLKDYLKKLDLKMEQLVQMTKTLGGSFR